MKRGGRGRGSWTAIPQLCVWRRRRGRRWRGWRRLVAAASAPPLPPPLSFLLPLSFPLHLSCSPSTFPNPPLSALPPYSASLTFTPFSSTSPYLIPPLFLFVSTSPPTFFLLPSFLPSFPQVQNLDKNQNFDKKINSFHIQITFCYQLTFRM